MGREIGVRVARGSEVRSRRRDGARRGSALVAEHVGSTTEAFPVGLAIIAGSWTLLAAGNDSAHASGAPAEGGRGHAIVVDLVAVGSSFLLLGAERRVVGVDGALVLLSSKGKRRGGTASAESEGRGAASAGGLRCSPNVAERGGVLLLDAVVVCS